MKRFFYLLSILTVIPLHANSELMLLDFEDPRQAKSFEGLKGNANSMTHVDDPALVISGKGSGKIFMPTGGQGEHRWPRLTFRFPRHLYNWDSFDELRFDYVNPTPEYDRLTMSLLDQDAVSYPFYGAKLDKKKGEVVWQLPEAIRGKEIRAVRFVIGDSPVERIVYIDNIRLTASEESFQKKCAEFMRRVMRETSVEQWQQAGMSKEREALIFMVQTVTDSKNDLLKRAGKLQEFVAKYEDLKIRMWQTLCRKNIEEFNRKFSADAVWGYAWTSGMQKVYRAELPFEGIVGGTPALSLAKREREGVQIVLRARKNLKDVKVSVTLDSPNSKLTVTPLLVGHVKVPKPGYLTEKCTWWPDPLLPYADKFPLDADMWQAVWLDVCTTYDCPAGVYTAKVTVTAPGVPSLHIPVNINVWNFVLPKFPTQPSLINFHTDSNHAAFIPKERREKVAAEFIAYRRGQCNFASLSPEAKKLRQLEIDTETLLLEHNVTPAPLYITRRRLAKADVQRWRDGGGRSFSVTYLPPKEAKFGKPFESWVENMVMNNLNNTVPVLAADGLMDGAYCYGFDEIKNDKFFAAMQLMKKVKAKYPKLKIITTTEDREFGKTNGLDKVVDAWCPQAERFIEQIDLVRQVQKAGKEVWYYVCCWDPGMDMLIEKSLTAPRLLCGFAQKKFGADGFLYYGVISGNKYQDMITAGPLTSHTGNNRSKYNGCGLLIYPTDKGPASCLRLKAMRDGFEDIEYYHLLKAVPAASLSPDDRKAREDLLNIPGNVVTGLENYDLSGRTTGAYRSKVGKFLDRVLQGKKVYAGKAPVPEISFTEKENRTRAEVGDTLTFTITAKADGEAWNEGSCTFVLDNSFNKRLLAVNCDFTKQNPVVVSYKVEDAMVITARLILAKDEKGKNITAKGMKMRGIACSPEKLLPGRPAPENFAGFWQHAREKSKTLKVTAEPFPDNFYNGYRASLLSVTVDGDTFQGILIVPAKSGKYPVTVNLPGAGSGFGKPWVDGSASAISLHVNVHRYPWTADQKLRTEYFQEANKKFGMNYFYYGAEKPETYFYYKSIIAICAFADHAVSIPEFDGRNLFATGSSQGGFLAAALTAIHGKVTALSINVPAMCDHFGHLQGRQSGWPELLKQRKDAAVTAGYYDAVNFAALINVPSLVAVGFLDHTAPAAGGYIFYNQLKGEKILLPMPDSGHVITPVYGKASKAFFLKNINKN
ncbi:MAG: DUF4091 domain-containing protein [Lentisphaerae bacterium]|nr:DUF4091 domain-containing protein [Lentisphaerota bacterium]